MHNLIKVCENINSSDKRYLTPLEIPLIKKIKEDEIEEEEELRVQKLLETDESNKDMHDLGGIKRFQTDMHCYTNPGAWNWRSSKTGEYIIKQDKGYNNI